MSASSTPTNGTFLLDNKRAYTHDSTPTSSPNTSQSASRVRSRRTSSTVSKPTSPLALTPVSPESPYRDTHDHSPPRTLPHHRRRRSGTSSTVSRTSSASPPPITRLPPDKEPAHAFDRTLLPSWHIAPELWARLPRRTQSALAGFQERGAGLDDARRAVAALFLEAPERAWPSLAAGGELAAGAPFDEISWHFYVAECRNFVQTMRVDAVGLVHAGRRLVNETVELGKVADREAVDGEQTDCNALGELVAWMERSGMPKAEAAKLEVDGLECPALEDIERERSGRAD